MSNDKTIIMKAKLQYNDYVVTCAADRSDFQTLEQYLANLGADTNRYKPIGITFYTGNLSDQVTFEIICIDKDGDKTKAVKIAIEGAELKDVISLFKRLEVFFVQDAYQNYELVDKPVKVLKIIR